MGKTIAIERHKYAPELNVLWCEDGTKYRVPNCKTIEDAEAYVVKHGLDKRTRIK